ncbi:hypothetical protein [Sphingorhabdus sp.]|uniref:hypothetical protein n=1 Tax=Sphingorhabdus sp. TaxID=1902408 RepID=UPI00333E1C1D
MKAKLAAAFWASTALMALPAQAQSVVNTQIDARVGLVAMTYIECAGVDFGLWRVPTRNTGGATFINLTVTANDATGVTIARIFGNSTSVSQDARHPPVAGTCYVFNAETVSSRLRTSIFQNNAMSMGGLPLYGLSSPSIQALVVADLALGGNGVAIDATGNGTFRVVGELTIPQNIVAANYGGYQTQGEGKVSVTDGL